MSSKFRARALDASKPMPIFRADELPDLPDFAAINRAVPLMPSGMEKEEECEHHLQRAMSAQQAYGQTGDLVIPTPEVYECSGSYEFIYPDDFKVPRQIIHMQPSAMEQDIPDYDMDSEDERWMLQQSKKIEVTPLQFEEMMDRLEKGSGQQVVTLKEAKSLLKEDDDLIISVYDYWLNKRLRMQHPLIPQVRTEKRDGSTNNNPYVAFRRRTEKMQTRKNRKNDEASYEKMLKLRRDLSRAVTLLEMVKRREKAKREQLHLTVEIFEKRYQAGDFNGQILAEVSAMRNTKPSYMPSHNSLSQYTINRQPEWPTRISKAEVSAGRKKREYRKRKHKEPQQTTGRGTVASASNKYADMDAGSCGLSGSSEDELTMGVSPEQEDENDPDGQFAFRRKKNCNYHSPILEGMGNWPWCSASEGGLADRKYRYCLASLSEPTTRCIGFARRRVGRGGRILLDRARAPLDGLWGELDGNVVGSTGASIRRYPRLPNGLQPPEDLWAEVRNDWLHFRPQTPPSVDDVDAYWNSGSDNLGARGERSLSCGSQPDVVGDCGATYVGGTTCRPGSDGEDEECVDPSGPDSLEFNVESFQSHQEELLAMQRRQTERLMASRGERDFRQRTYDGADGSSQFTVDSAGAQFAVSAVVNTACVWGAPASSLAPAACPSAAGAGGHNSIALSNGPSNARSAAGLASIPPHCRPPSERMTSTFAGHHTSRSVNNLAGVQQFTPTTSSPTRPSPLKSAMHESILGQLESTTASGDIIVDSEDPATTPRTTSANPKTKVERLLNENSLPMEVT